MEKKEAVRFLDTIAQLAGATNPNLPTGRPYKTFEEVEAEGGSWKEYVSQLPSWHPDWVYQ